MSAQLEITPGPWHHVEWDCDPRVDQSGNRYWGIKPIKFHNGAAYLEASGWMTEANARLIAAAPELLEASRHALEVLAPRKGNDLVWSAISHLVAAIAKATGDQS